MGWVELSGSCSTARQEPFPEARRGKPVQLSNRLQKNLFKRETSLKPKKRLNFLEQILHLILAIGRERYA